MHGNGPYILMGLAGMFTPMLIGIILIIIGIIRKSKGSTYHIFFILSVPCFLTSLALVMKDMGY
jgi:hypothetical protein